MKCDKCNNEYEGHKLETISQSHARRVYGFDDNRLGHYYICVKCRNGINMSTKPCPIPTDPEQKNDIICAICGTPISFEKKEVYVKDSSYVCCDCTH